MKIDVDGQKRKKTNEKIGKWTKTYKNRQKRQKMDENIKKMDENVCKWTKTSENGRKHI